MNVTLTWRALADAGGTDLPHMKIATTLTPSKVSALAVRSGLNVAQLEKLVYGSIDTRTTVSVIARNKDADIASRFLSSLVAKGLATYAR